METTTLQDLHQGLMALMQKVNKIEINVEEIHSDLHQVRPEYLEKLERIKQAKTHHFENKEEFLVFLENEI